MNITHEKYTHHEIKNDEITYTNLDTHLLLNFDYLDFRKHFKMT